MDPESDEDWAAITPLSALVAPAAGSSGDGIARESSDEDWVSAMAMGLPSDDAGIAGGDSDEDWAGCATQIRAAAPEPVGPSDGRADSDAIAPALALADGSGAAAAPAGAAGLELAAVPQDFPPGSQFAR